jgi:hypothetical protein
MSSSAADEASLDRALRELAEAWAATGDGWRDGARSEFDRDHLTDILWRGHQGMKALTELSALCADAQRRCG